MTSLAQMQNAGGAHSRADGDGRYATLAHCRVLTVELHPTLAAAQKAKAFTDRMGCGGNCHDAHEIVDLGAGGNCCIGKIAV